MFYQHLSAIYINSLLSLGRSLNDVTVSSCYVFHARLSPKIVKYCFFLLLCYCVFLGLHKQSVSSDALIKLVFVMHVIA